MAKQATRGQPKKHYTSTSGDTIKGLSRGNDGRWRIIDTGYRFTEPNEAAAIAKFRKLTGTTGQIIMSGKFDPNQEQINGTVTLDGQIGRAHV